jgi:signal recognition particle GTPase
MKSVRQIFKGNEHLTGFGPVEELIEYCQELEGQVLERKVEDNYDKEHMLKSMLQDILTSCRDMEETNQLAERYPGMYEKSDAESLVKNLKNYITEMNYKNNLGL